MDCQIHLGILLGNQHHADRWVRRLGCKQSLWSHHPYLHRDLQLHNPRLQHQWSWSSYKLHERGRSREKEKVKVHPSHVSGKLNRHWIRVQDIKLRGEGVPDKGGFRVRWIWCRFVISSQENADLVQEGS